MKQYTQVPEIETEGWTYIGYKEYAEEMNTDEAGKYLFFHTDRNLLIKIAKKEIHDNEFKLAKVSKDERSGSHVLCLYWYNDSRAKEFKNKYPNVAYRWWKSNKATREGLYSQQFLDSLPFDVTVEY